MSLAFAPIAGSITLDEIQLLDLATAQQIALADNPSLAATAERVEQARALYYPSIDSGGTAASGRISDADAAAQSFFLGATDVDRNSENYRLSLGASWLLFDGFSRKFSNLIAEHSIGKIDNGGCLVLSLRKFLLNSTKDISNFEKDLDQFRIKMFTAFAADNFVHLFFFPWLFVATT